MNRMKREQGIFYHEVPADVIVALHYCLVMARPEKAWDMDTLRTVQVWYDDIKDNIRKADDEKFQTL